MHKVYPVCFVEIVYCTHYVFHGIIAILYNDRREAYTVGKTSSAVKDRYNAKAYDEIKVRVPKGKKEEIKSHADKFDGGSVNGFIYRAITSQMEQDTAGQTQTATEE